MPTLTLANLAVATALVVTSTLLLHHQLISGVLIDSPARRFGSHRPPSPSTSPSFPAASIILPSPSASSASPTPTPPAVCSLHPSPAASVFLPWPLSSPAASLLPSPSSSPSPAARGLLPSPSSSPAAGLPPSPSSSPSPAARGLLPSPSSSPAAGLPPSPSTSSSSSAPSPSVDPTREHSNSLITYMFGAVGFYLLAVTFYGIFWPNGLRKWEKLLKGLVEWYKTSTNRFLVIFRHNIHAVYVFALAALITMIIKHSIWPLLVLIGNNQNLALGLEELDRFVKTITELVSRR